MTTERDTLSEHIHFLGDLLGQTIIEQEGQDLFDLIEYIRALAKAQRQGDASAGPKLLDILTGLAAGEMEVVIKAFATYFQLVNLAEDQARVRVLHERALRAEVEDRPMGETIADAVATLHRQGLSAEEMQAHLDRLLIIPVITAHPTEAKRRTMLIKLTRIARQLHHLDFHSLRPDERRSGEALLREEITSIWQTDETRANKPKVLDEVRNGLYFFESALFDLIPQLYAGLEGALGQYYPGHSFTLKPFLRFGSWIGGDRDGNPFVTPAVTEETLRAQKAMAVRLYMRSIENNYGMLSTSERFGASPELVASLEADAAFFADDPLPYQQRYPRQPYRQKIGFIHRKLALTLEATAYPWQADRLPHPGEYPTEEALLADLYLLRDSLLAHRGQRLVSGRLGALIRQVEVFGLHLASLDIRQHSGRHTEALAEIFDRYGMAAGYANWSEEQKEALLTQELQNPRPLTPLRLDFSPATNETVEVFRLIRLAHERVGLRAVKSYVISMCSCPSDVLAVLLLAQDAGVAPNLGIVPLFETIEDLRTASGVMERLFLNPAYGRHLERHSRGQQIMIGYSDSNKDGGYVSSNVELHLAQGALAQTCASHAINLMLFHGRGGTIGRGGGPANRAILSQPAEAIRGRIKLTEQGEVVSARFANQAVGQRYLEQLAHAVMVASAQSPAAVAARVATWRQTMAALSELAQAHYQALVYETPAMLDFFHQATPIDEISKLNIGSRPARRTAAGGIAQLRAIPWVFSWTQSRVNLPGWYGLGAALNGWACDDEGRWQQLGEMYRDWLFFQTLIDNAQMSLRKADRSIAGLYAGLAESDVAEAVFPPILAEFERTETAILHLTGQRALLDNERWLQRAITLRNPYVDPLNYAQVALLRRMRQVQPEGDVEALRQVVLDSVNGIAAGLRNTG